MTVTYWRERNFEVDFVLRHGGSVIGVEVKSGRNKGSLAGLERFTRDFDTRPGLVVGTEGHSPAAVSRTTGSGMGRCLTLIATRATRRE
jgi:predicted AAA+ superfamily ATPase